MSIFTLEKKCFKVNPTFANLEIVAYCQSKNIAVTGYGTLGFAVTRPFNDLRLQPRFDNPILVAMAQKYCVDVSQIFSRYSVNIPYFTNYHHLQL